MPSYGTTQTLQTEVLSVFGDPNNGYDGQMGQLAVDVTEPLLYIKTTEPGDLTGWQVVGGGSSYPPAGGSQIYQNAGDPNNTVLHDATSPAMCIDTTNHIVWVKTDGIASNTGWGAP